MNPLTLSQTNQGYFINVHARQFSPHTIKDYKNVLEHLQKFLKADFPMSEISTRHLEMFLAAQTHLKKKTALNYHTALSALWAWSAGEQLVQENIVRRIKPPKPEITLVIPYTVDEMKLMLANLDRVKLYTRPGQTWQDRKTMEPERARAIILLLCDTGLRAEELCSIKIGHVDKRLMRIKVFGKGAKERYVNFSTRTAQALWRYLATKQDHQKDSDYLFTVRQLHGGSGKLNRDRLLKMLITIGNRAGVKEVNVHRFRHFFAIQYLRNRGDVYTLQRLLGHSTLDMVKRCLAVVQTDVDSAYTLASPVGNLNL